MYSTESKATHCNIKYCKTFINRIMRPYFSPLKIRSIHLIKEEQCIDGFVRIACTQHHVLNDYCGNTSNVLFRIYVD